MSNDASLSLDAPDASPLWDTKTSLRLAGLTFATFALVFSEFLPAGLLTPLARGLSISEGMAGQAVTATALIGCPAALLAGMAIRDLDRKLVMLAFCAMIVISDVAAAFAGNFAILIAARLLLGVAIGGFWSLEAGVVARLVPIESIGKGMSIVFIGVSTATICAPPLGALIAEAFGWRSAFVLGAAAGFLGLVINAVSLPRLPPSAVIDLRSLLALVRRPVIRMGLLAVLAVAGGHFIGFTYIRPLLETTSRLDPTMIAAVLLSFGVANFIGNIIGGVAADKNPSLALAVVGSLIGLPLLALAVFGNQPAVAAILVTVWGAAFGAAPIVLQTRIVRAAPDQLEASGGLLIAAFQLSIMLAGALGGAVVDHLGNAAVMVAAGAISLAAVALAVAPARTRVVVVAAE